MALVSADREDRARTAGDDTENTDWFLAAEQARDNTPKDLDAAHTRAAGCRSASQIKLK